MFKIRITLLLFSFPFFTKIMSLNFGLNIRNKNQKFKNADRAGMGVAGIKRKLNPLLDQDEEESEDQDKAQSSVQRVNTQIKSVATTQKSLIIQQEALKTDKDIFNYDASFDEIKRNELQKKMVRDGIVDGKKKARYMDNLIKASQQKKVEYERALQRKIETERKMEGEMFKDKEQFITEAYVEKQAQLKEMEEEERLKDGYTVLIIVEEADPNRIRDVVGFYRNILDARDRTGMQTVPISAEKQQLIKQMEEDELNFKQKQNHTSLPSLKINDSEEIVDKRDLLAGGLNMTFKAERRQTMALEEKLKVERDQNDARLNRERAKEQYLRNKMLVSEQQRKLKEEMVVRVSTEIKETQEKLQTKVSNTAIVSAKERYLQRKRQAADTDSSTINQ